MKIRVLATEVETKSMARFGAAGVPMDIADVLPALQRRALDGIRSIVPILDARKFWTTTKYITVVNDTYIPLVAWVGMPAFRKLSPQQQQAMLRIGAELEPYIIERANAQNQAAYDNWKKNGGEVIQLSKEDRAEFMKRVGSVADEVMGNDPQLKETYALFKEVASKTRSR
jgi:TRAP-type C4-dicarboxylate transport system substrate-binding protein